MSGWIGVDLDGTLAHYDGWKGIEHVGAPIAPMCDRVNVWLLEGREVRIFTARVTEIEGRDLAEILKPIDAFSIAQFGIALRVTNVKDFGMIQLWDDRAIQVEMNTGARSDGK